MLIDNMVYIHNVKLLRIKKNEVMPFASLVAQRIKHFLYCRRPGFDPCVGKVHWRREWLSTPVLLPGEFHRQRNLEDYCPWMGSKKSWKLLSDQQMQAKEIKSIPVIVLIH